jgi:hypothetical protein
MVSEYVVGQWLFVRFCGMDCFGKFVHAKEHQVVVDVFYAESKPANYLPTRAVDYFGQNGLRNPPSRVDFGRAACLIAPVEPPLVLPA